MTPSFFVTCMCVVCMCMYACLHVLKHMCEYEYMAGWGGGVAKLTLMVFVNHSPLYLLREKKITH